MDSLEEQLPECIAAALKDCVKIHEVIKKLLEEDPCIEYTVARYQLESVYKNLKRKGVQK